MWAEAQAELAYISGAGIWRGNLEAIVIAHLDYARVRQSMLDREHRMLMLVVAGYGTEEIAKDLRVSARSAARYMSELRLSLLQQDPRS